MNFFDFTPQFDAPYWGTNVQGSYCPKTKEYPFGSKLVLALNAPENIQALEMCFECLRTRRSKKSHFSVNQFSGSLIRGRGHVAGRELFTKQKSQNISAYLTYLSAYLSYLPDNTGMQNLNTTDKAHNI